MKRVLPLSLCFLVVLVLGGCSLVAPTGVSTTSTNNSSVTTTTTAAKTTVTVTATVIHHIPAPKPKPKPKPAPKPSTSNQLSLIVEPNAGRAPLLSYIESARKSVDVVMYEFDDPVLENALVADSQRGVMVRVLLNSGYYGSGFPQDAAALAFFRAHKIAVRQTPKYFALTHQKTVIVDNTSALILTLNFTAQYYASSRDFGVIDRNQADVAAIERTFNADYNNTKIASQQGSDLIWSPGSLPATLALINVAHKSIDIYNEEMDDADVTNALVAAAKRGVNVRVVMTYSSSWKAAFTALAQAGVHVRVYAANASLYIHAKMILVDGGGAFLGSENFSANSLNHNRELGLLITQPSVLQTLAATFNTDYAHAAPYS